MKYGGLTIKKKEIKIPSESASTFVSIEFS